MDPAEIHRLVSELPSRTVWGARRGVGTFVTIDVGGRYPRVSRGRRLPDDSDLHLWIYLSEWQLTRDDRPVLSSDSDPDVYPAILAGLVGRELDAVELGAHPGELELRFTGGYRFVLWENLDEYEPDDDLLVLYRRGHIAVGYNATRGFNTDGDVDE